MASFKGYVRSQRRPQATGNETPFFVFLRVWGGVEDVNVPVNLLTSCMLRETSGFGWGGGDGNVPVNLLTSCMLRETSGFGWGGGDVNVPVNFGVAWVIYIYIILHNESHI